MQHFWKNPQLCGLTWMLHNIELKLCKVPSSTFVIKDAIVISKYWYKQHAHHSPADRAVQQEHEQDIKAIRQEMNQQIPNYVMIRIFFTSSYRLMESKSSLCFSRGRNFISIPPLQLCFCPYNCAFYTSFQNSKSHYISSNETFPLSFTRFPLLDRCYVKACNF